MRMNGKLLKSKAKFTRDELADLLEDLAGRIRDGQLTLGEGAGQVEMEVANTGKRVLKRELELEFELPVGADGTPLERPDPRSGFTVA